MKFIIKNEPDIDWSLASVTRHEVVEIKDKIQKCVHCGETITDDIKFSTSFSYDANGPVENPVRAGWPPGYVYVHRCGNSSFIVGYLLQKERNFIDCRNKFS